MSTFIFGRQIKAARILIGWSQKDLAREADIGLATLKRFEASNTDGYGQRATASRIAGALEKGGILFLDSESDLGPGVRLRNPQPENL